MPAATAVADVMLAFSRSRAPVGPYRAIRSFTTDIGTWFGFSRPACRCDPQTPLYSSSTVNPLNTSRCTDAVQLSYTAGRSASRPLNQSTLVLLAKLGSICGGSG